LPAGERERWIMAQDDTAAVRDQAWALLGSAAAASLAEFLEPTTQQDQPVADRLRAGERASA